MKKERLNINGSRDLGNFEKMCRDPKACAMTNQAAFIQKLKEIHLIAMSFSGVLTPPFVYQNDKGEKTFRFSNRDLLAVELLKKYKYEVVVISNRRTSVVANRCEKMGVGFYTAEDVLKDGGKHAVLNHIMDHWGLMACQTMYIGDDINDLEVMTASGLAVAVRDARTQVANAADYVTDALGGEHAIREIAELLLVVKGYELKL